MKNNVWPILAGLIFIALTPCTWADTCSGRVSLDSWSQDYPDLSNQYAKALSLVKNTDRPTLSVVIPAFREEKRIGQSIKAIREFFDQYPYPVEILVRIEKSPDQTVSIAQGASEGDPRIRVFPHSVQRGKGYAVRSGMLDTIGEYVLFMDTDLSTPLPEIFNFLAQVADGDRSDVWIGDRQHPQSRIKTEQSTARQLMGATFRGVIQAVLNNYGLKGINDTQCGFKMFRQSVSRHLFSMAQVDGFAFDIELLLMAAELGYQVRPLPVVWHNDPRSTVHPIWDPLKMLRDVITMRRQVRAHLLTPSEVP